MPLSVFSSVRIPSDSRGFRSLRLGDVSGGLRVNVTVMGTLFANNLLLHSRTTHPAVLINTNGWHGYGELKSEITKRVLDATNFVTRLRSRRRGCGGSVHTTKASIAPQGLQRSLRS